MSKVIKRLNIRERPIKINLSYRTKVVALCEELWTDATIKEEILEAEEYEGKVDCLTTNELFEA